MNALIINHFFHNHFVANLNTYISHKIFQQSSCPINDVSLHLYSNRGSSIL